MKASIGCERAMANPRTPAIARKSPRQRRQSCVHFTLIALTAVVRPFRLRQVLACMRFPMTHGRAGLATTRGSEAGQAPLRSRRHLSEGGGDHSPCPRFAHRTQRSMGRPGHTSHDIENHCPEGEDAVIGLSEVASSSRRPAPCIALTICASHTRSWGSISAGCHRWLSSTCSPCRVPPPLTTESRSWVLR